MKPTFQPASFLNQAAKRGFDILASFFGLILLSPVFLFIAIAIKRESPGPVFYGGKRAGKNNKPFYIWKFRTMYETPQSYAGPAVTAQDDRRITPLGHWLRDAKLNELPQLWNVLVGDMSFVGPRPEDWDIAQKEWSEEARAEILSMRPGITSPASIIYRNEEKMLAGEDFMTRYYSHILPDKMRLDKLYVRHHSLLGDIDIILWTLAALLPQIISPPVWEGGLFGGPISRFVRFNLAWFLADTLIALASAALVGGAWRATGPIDVGLGNSFVFAVLLSIAFGSINAILGLNSVAWSRAVPEDVIGIVVSAVSVIGLAAAVNFFLHPLEFPSLLLVMIGLTAMLGFVAVRYRWQLISSLSMLWSSRQKSLSVGERVLIVGAGEEGEYVSWLLRRGDLRLAFTVIGLVDDNPRLQGMRLDGNWVIGSLADAPRIIETSDVGMAAIAVPDMERDAYSRLIDACAQSGTRVLIVSDLLRAMQNWLTKSGKLNPESEIKPLEG